MFFGLGKRTTHLTLWTLETSTFLIFLIRSIDGSTQGLKKYLTSWEHRFRYTTFLENSVILSDLCHDQKFSTELMLRFVLFSLSLATYPPSHLATYSPIHPEKYQKYNVEQFMFNGTCRYMCYAQNSYQTPRKPIKQGLTRLRMTMI